MKKKSFFLYLKQAWIDLNRLNYWSYQIGEETLANTAVTGENGNQSAPSLIMWGCIPLK
jgi:hypothetical protein